MKVDDIEDPYARETETGRPEARVPNAQDFPLEVSETNPSDSWSSELAGLFRSCADESEGMVSIQRNQLLFREGDPTDSLYLLESGRIRVYIQNASGQEITIASLAGGSIIGEMTLFGETTRSASCAAESEQATLLLFPNATAVQLLDRNPNLRRSLFRSLIQRSRSMLAFIDEFSNLTQLVASGSYGDVQKYINETADGGDSTIKAARASFTQMIERVRLRENELQQKIQTLSIEIDHARARMEVDEISNAEGFLDLLGKAESIRSRSRERKTIEEESV
jgi:CRP-like cAMP-binding protein